MLPFRPTGVLPLSRADCPYAYPGSRSYTGNMNRVRFDNDEPLLANGLSEVARAERRWLLGMSLLLLAMSFGELVPKKIDALGVELTTTASRSLVLLLIGVELYFLLAFRVYSAADRALWHARLRGIQDTLAGDTETIDAVAAQDRVNGHKDATHVVAPLDPPGEPTTGVDRALEQVRAELDKNVRRFERKLLQIHEIFGPDLQLAARVLPLWRRVRRYRIRLFLDVWVPIAIGVITPILVGVKLVVTK